jgi:alpha-D-ribose 1-methylphosphonate 5-phosphate C-P lyase
MKIDLRWHGYNIGYLEEEIKSQVKEGEVHTLTIPYI